MRISPFAVIVMYVEDLCVFGYTVEYPFSWTSAVLRRAISDSLEFVEAWFESVTAITLYEDLPQGFIIAALFALPFGCLARTA